MRITCEQCGKNIHSSICSDNCDFDKRQAQFDRIHEEVKDIQLKK